MLTLMLLLGAARIGRLVPTLELGAKAGPGICEDAWEHCRYARTHTRGVVVAHKPQGSLDRRRQTVWRRRSAVWDTDCPA
jgi:hypothetical protein